MALESLAAAELLAARGLSASVGVMAHLPAEPMPELVDVLRRHGTVLTAEEGTLTGGLSSLVGQAIARQAHCLALTRWEEGWDKPISQWRQELGITDAAEHEPYGLAAQLP